MRGFGLKLAPDGGAAMPLKDVHGRLYNVKFVSPDGSSRRAAADNETPPLMHLIDPARRVREDAVIVAGDYLSGAAIHKATRLPVAVVEEPEKTMDVARALRERHPDSKLVIAADGKQAEALKEKAGAIRAAIVAPPEGSKSFAEGASEPDTIRDVLARPAGDAVWLRWREAEPVGKDSVGRRRQARRSSSGEGRPGQKDFRGAVARPVAPARSEAPSGADAGPGPRARHRTLRRSRPRSGSVSAVSAWIKRGRAAAMGVGFWRGPRAARGIEHAPGWESRARWRRQVIYVLSAPRAQRSWIEFGASLRVPLEIAGRILWPAAFVKHELIILLSHSNPDSYRRGTWFEN